MVAYDVLLNAVIVQPFRGLPGGRVIIYPVPTRDSFQVPATYASDSVCIPQVDIRHQNAPFFPDVLSQVAYGVLAPRRRCNLMP
jgi:hypothetical protein